MISLYIAFLRWRAKHHAGRAQLFTDALLMAHARCDVIAVCYFYEQREQARAKRDRLTLKASAMERRSSREESWLHADGETCPPCTGDCNQGDCLGSVNASRVALGMRPLSRR